MEFAFWGLKPWLNEISGAIAFMLCSAFAVQIWKQKLSLNIASWSMIMGLDLIGVILAIAAGNHRPYLQLAWLAASFVILTAVFLRRGSWKWGSVETVSTILAVSSLIFWWISGVETGLWWFLLAFYTAMFPQIKDLWLKPNPSTNWMWLQSAVVAGIQLLGLEILDIGHVLVPAGALVLNLGMAFLSDRRVS